MFVILNDKKEFYVNGIEFTTDFAKAETFENYGDAYNKYRELCKSGISVTIDEI